MVFLIWYSRQMKNKDFTIIIVHAIAILFLWFGPGLIDEYLLPRSVGGSNLMVVAGVNILLLIGLLVSLIYRLFRFFFKR